MDKSKPTLKKSLNRLIELAREKETITFIKLIEDKYMVIKEARTGKKTIALNSMRITKIKRIK